jgi:hypothetical protein
MRPIEFDRNHGAERACPLLAMLAWHCNREIIDMRQHVIQNVAT